MKDILLDGIVLFMGGKVIKEQRRLSLLRKRTELKKAETRLENARRDFADELLLASREDKSSYQELGRVVGLSRQRIHQLIGGK